MKPTNRITSSLKGTGGYVPNGSEHVPNVKVGRKPNATDAQLLAHVEKLHIRHGRMPTLTEVADAVGGCQRARAVSARQAYQQSLQQSTLDTQIHMPADIETRHRKLMCDWLSMAKQQLAPILDTITDEAQQQTDKAADVASLAIERLDTARLANEVSAQANADMLQKIQRLEARIQKLNRSEARWKTKAEERARNDLFFLNSDFRWKCYSGWGDVVLMAVRQRHPDKTIVHSDQGSQYGSDDWRRFCRTNRLEPSMSRRGNCWDTLSRSLSSAA